MTTQELTLAALHELGVHASLEHPSYIHIPTTHDHFWAFGTVNESWDGDYKDGQGRVLMTSTLPFPSYHYSDGRDIAAAIVTAMESELHLRATPRQPVTIYYCKAGLADGMIIRLLCGRDRFAGTAVRMTDATSSMALDNSPGPAKRSGARCCQIVTQGSVFLTKPRLL